MNVVDVLGMLAGNPEETFLEFSAFNGRSFGTCSFTGVSPGWEMHPDTDEFFYVIEGAVEITLLEKTAQRYVAPAGSSFVVPRGIWHKPGAPNGAKFIYFTPGQSLYSEQEDPRVERHASALGPEGQAAR
ncbi:cupin domain-containing protein [Parvularcula sp. ZS-1/3]|uniref:Cupin domain-containing protein n=1 Tax=Parvularcula mediterranea TaxID=2732508 RepID=A0A7Y3RPN6_9PROT|nr:cupin domain-containing protein [Parvularcula mediterranea]NNU17520.1 cupin domain-containing protein [Parvularcula mediterranea]